MSRLDEILTQCDACIAELQAAAAASRALRVILQPGRKQLTLTAGADDGGEEASVVLDAAASATYLAALSTSAAGRIRTAFDNLEKAAHNGRMLCETRLKAASEV